MNETSWCRCGSGDPPDLMHFLRILFKGSPWVTRKETVRVTPRKRDSKTAIRSPFVHSACRRHGLEYRHGGQLECGQWCGRAGAFARAAGSTTGLTRALFGGRTTGSIREGWMTASDPQRSAELTLLI